MIVFVSKFKAILFALALIFLFTSLMQSILSKGQVKPVATENITISKLQIESIQIMNNKEEAELYPVIEILCSDEIESGNVSIQEVAGITQIEGNKIIYRPKLILQPDTDYMVSIEIKGVGDTNYQVTEWPFRTRSLDPETLWVEVALTEAGHKVYIRQGKEQIQRDMFCSGGTEQEPTIYGTYYLENRGPEFFAERFNEGAKYWVRIKDQYLFHSIPRDREGNLIEEELEKFGSAASHGCIRLLDEDAKWFYENIPDGTMVIIHD